MKKLYIINLTTGETYKETNCIIESLLKFYQEKHPNERVVYCSEIDYINWKKVG